MLIACGGSENASDPTDTRRVEAPARPEGEVDTSGGAPQDDTNSVMEPTQGAPGDDAANEPGAADEMAEPLASASESYVMFVDPGSGFSTVDVHDADRQVVHFDAELQAMISSTSGAAIGGWSTRDTDLSWSRSGVAFRVRFGTEGGQRRAYFTETDRGTICNLTISGPDSLAISATSETPPLE